MKTISISYYSERTYAHRAAFACVALVALALLATNAVFVGLSIREAAVGARASARADALAGRIAELGVGSSAANIVTPRDAEARGFATPSSLSYATKRPLGRLPAMHAQALQAGAFLG